MKIGISMFPTDYSITPADLAQAAEERGFESLWFPEHTHIPTSRKSPWPGGPNLPDVYKQSLDPFLALTAAATATKRIRLATGICLVVERDPIHTAKNVATLDYLSGGRFIFGIGGGWNAEEMANHGTVFKTRFALMRERIEAMKAIWTSDIAEYHGEHVNFDPMWAWPKPVQKPHPPIILGGEFSARRQARDRLWQWLDADRRPRARYPRCPAALPASGGGSRPQSRRRADERVRRAPGHRSAQALQGRRHRPRRLPPADGRARRGPEEPRRRRRVCAGDRLASFQWMQP
jgi:probable F420-dependent oxidoreductase